MARNHRVVQGPQRQRNTAQVTLVKSNLRGVVRGVILGDGTDHYHVIDTSDADGRRTALLMNPHTGETATFAVDDSPGGIGELFFAGTWLGGPPRRM